MSDDTKVYLSDMAFAEVEDILDDVELALSAPRVPAGLKEQVK